MDLMTRRRMLSSGKEAMYAVRREDNPITMDRLFAAGLSKDSDYMTIQEAKAVTADALYNSGALNNDEPLGYLRWFTEIKRVVGSVSKINNNSICLKKDVSGIHPFMDLRCIEVFEQQCLRYNRYPCDIVIDGGNIGWLAFDNSGLVNLVSLSLNPPTVVDMPKASTLYVPTDALDAYGASSVFSGAFAEIKSIDEYTNYSIKPL